MEHEERPLWGGSDDGRAQLLVRNVPTEEFGAKLRQAAGVRRLDRSSSPHNHRFEKGNSPHTPAL